MLTVKDVMVPKVVTISPYSSLREALSAMKENAVKSLVVEPQHPHDAYGMLSYRELLQTVVAEEGDVDLLNVYDAATIPAITVNEDLSVRQAATLMSRYDLSRLVVVEGNKLVGLLAMNDILARLMDDLT
ncbi:CBS domain-containing protein [Pseudarthrobacter sp. J75]|uniref:CBS domain-containing protein n=1 Tax=unclassified Pseudarthrobacter TaxID=2647000 RepID=UPI002E80F965|nr:MULTISPECIES: CBS domain-containing protein [unclassified Pseudarthrobacter]MEE2524466.1 CBS domain-containing protein [Pseudarthrobacter sp. J47]MEE2530654.1 CBS domain-containing protein [Pseudarthrobacter sp. J75]MEE2569540.1 CBS domain-containing protein [Pseudarthrobacter sp. J64]